MPKSHPFGSLSNATAYPNPPVAKPKPIPTFRGIEHIMVFLEELSYSNDTPIRSSDMAFIRDMSRLYQMDRNYSTGQVGLCVRKIQNYQHLIETDITDIIDGPICIREPYVSVPMPRQVRFAGNSTLLFRSKFSPQVSKYMKRMNKSKQTQLAKFDYLNKIWVVKVCAENIDMVHKAIGDLVFEFDDSVIAFLAGCDAAKTANSNATCINNDLTVTVYDDPILDGLIDLIGWENV